MHLVKYFKRSDEIGYLRNDMKVNVFNSYPLDLEPKSTLHNGPSTSYTP